jgi:DNA-binding MarR family transcriptional regulator
MRTLQKEDLDNEYMNISEYKPQESSPENADPAAWPHEALKCFRLIFRAVQQHSQWVESCCGVSYAQLWAMSELSNNAGMKVSELARAMSLHQSTASNLLVKLEKKGLIRRERTHADQRVVRLYLTDAGQALVDRSPEPRQGLLLQALQELPPPVLVALTRNLDLLVEAMHISDEQAAMQPLNMSVHESGSKTMGPRRKPRSAEGA